MKYTILPFLFLLLGSLAADAETMLTRNAIATFEGIVVTSDPILETEGDDKIQLLGLHSPGLDKKMKKRLASFIGKPITSESLQELKETILSSFQGSAISFASVKIPTQKLEKQCVRCIVCVPTVGKISLTGNHWFSDDSISDAASLKSGEVLNEQSIQNNLSLINRNPFIHSDLILSPPSMSQATDGEIVTKDRFPLRIYAGADDTGSEATNKNRFFTGFNASLGLCSLLSYQFMSSIDFPEFLSHFANLTFFLPWKHQLTLFGGWSTIHPDISGFSSSGNNIQASGRYDIPLNSRLYTPSQHALRFGYDYKKIGNSLFFLGDVPTSPIPVSTQTAAISQFYLGYHYEDVRKNNLTMHVEALFSPCLMVPHQNQTDYDAIRVGANPRYVYGRIAAGSVFELPKSWAIALMVRGQGASTALLPSEQFGLGGYDTVRGYDERAFLADNAFCANLEFHAPTISFFSNKRDELIFLAFADVGWGHNFQTSFAEGTVTQLYGVGPGVRYNIGPYLTSRLDYGFRLHETPFEQFGFGRFHFSVIVGY